MEYRRARFGLLGLDVGRADYAFVFPVFLAEICSEVRTASSHRIEPLYRKLCLDLGCMDRFGEPGGELRYRLLRRLGGHNQAEPSLLFVILIAGFGNRRNIWHRLDPCP